MEALYKPNAAVGSTVTINNVKESEHTTIWVTKKTWSILNKKRQCGESFDDVINRVMVVGGEVIQ